MLPFQAAAGATPAAWLSAEKLATALPKYREVLRSSRTSRRSEEETSLFQQAKERVLLRLRERRRTARHDPRRAFGRVQERWAAARLSLRTYREEQKERLRQYYASALAGGAVPSSSAAEVAAPPLASRSLPQAAAAAAEAGALDARAAAAALGTNGPLRHLVLAGVGGACKLFVSAGARSSVVGAERMAAALDREPGRGLITVSNHVGAIDDPLITASLVPASKLLEPRALRWTMCATDRCFKSALLAPFFRAAKVLPVERGAGLSQFGMQLAQARLAAGDWVHIFPEGTRSRDGRMLPVRKGVGWLVASAAAAGAPPPLVLPFVHSGMERVMPKGAALPKLGQELRVLVGEPVVLDDLMAQALAGGWDESRLQVAIADRVGQALYALKAELEGLALEDVAPQPRAAALSISEDTLLPMIEDEMDSLAHRWHDRWQRLSLPSLTQRLRSKVTARRAALGAAGASDGGLLAGMFSGGASFEDVAAATEEAAGVISGWEHAGAAPAPWSLDATALQAEAAALAGPAEAAAAGTAPLARLNLRLLRGGAVQAAAAARAAADTGNTSTAALAAGGGGRAADLVAASPLDPTVVAGSSSSDSLSGLLAAAASYSAVRVRHMQHLMAAPPPAPAAGDARMVM